MWTFQILFGVNEFFPSHILTLPYLSLSFLHSVFLLMIQLPWLLQYYHLLNLIPLCFFNLSLELVYLWCLNLFLVHAANRVHLLLLEQSCLYYLILTQSLSSIIKIINIWITLTYIYIKFTYIFLFTNHTLPKHFE